MAPTAPEGLSEGSAATGRKVCSKMLMVHLSIHHVTILWNLQRTLDFRLLCPLEDLQTLQERHLRTFI